MASQRRRTGSGPILRARPRWEGLPFLKRLVAGSNPAARASSAYPCRVAQLSVDPPVEGPCGAWAKRDDCLRFGFLTAEQINNDSLDACLDVASETLYRKTAMQWPGQCTQKVWPVTRQFLNDQPMLWWESLGYTYIPDLIDGVWWNFTVPFGFPDPALPWDNGQQIPTIELGAYPVTDILSVKIDGAELDPSAYRLDNWHQLVRIDGQRWPTKQNLLAASDSEPGTFTIQFKFGTVPPVGGVMACAELASEMVKHADPKLQTQLPLRVTAVTRQGVTYSLPDVMAIIDKGRTGLYFVDLFLQTVNPSQLQAPPRVLTPDLPAGPRRLGS